MKTVTFLLSVLLVGCVAVPTKVSTHPERYNCDIVISTVWDGSHPVEYFEHEMVVGQTYRDPLGMKYSLEATAQDSVFLLRIPVPRR